MPYKNLSPVEWIVVILVALLLSFVLLSNSFGEAPPEGLTTDCEIVNVVDGDTVDLKVSYVIRIRLIDCWAPESRTLDREEKRRGIKATKYMQALAEERPKVRLHIPGGNSLADILTFDRILGRIWRLDEDGIPEERDLSETMIGAKHATRRKQAK